MSSSSAFHNLPPLVDVDCNLFHRDLKSFQDRKEDLFLLTEDAVKESNIVAMLSPSSTLTEADKGLIFLSANQTIIPIRTTVGIHPYHVLDEDIKDKDVQEIAERIKGLLLRYPEFCVAVGECGLDASEGFPPIEAQLPLFEGQIAVAQSLKLPLFVHERLAFDSCWKLLEAVTTPVIVHCFTGTKPECRAYVERGYFISLSGYIFKDEASEVRECLEDGIIPLERLMVETDAPYMGFPGCRDSYVAKHADFVESLNSRNRKKLLNGIYPNVPSALQMVLAKVLEHVNIGRSRRSQDPLTLNELALQTSRNADHFFKFGLML